MNNQSDLMQKQFYMNEDKINKITFETLFEIFTCIKKYPVCRCKLNDTCNTLNSPSRRMNVKLPCGKLKTSN